MSSLWLCGKLILSMGPQALGNMGKDRAYSGSETLFPLSPKVIRAGEVSPPLPAVSGGL